MSSPRNHDRDGDEYHSIRSMVSKDSWMSTQTEVTTTTEEEKVVLDASTSRNRCVSWWIFVLAFCGVICGVYSTLSCEWFAWTPLDDDDAWGVFAVDSTANQAESVGLFRYFNDNEEEDGTFDNKANSFDTLSCQFYLDPRHKDWILIARETDRWMFTAQLCWLNATILAAISMVATLARIFCCHGSPSQTRLSCYVACGWLLASGLQAASCLAATALCGGFDFWNCPWLQGAHASAGAAWFYLLCWLLSMCGYQFVGVKSQITINHIHHHHSNHHHNHDRPIRRDETAEEEKEEVDAPTRIHYKMTAEELLGTNDPIIHRAVGQKAVVIREFAATRPMEDEDDDNFDDTTSTETLQKNGLDDCTVVLKRENNSISLEP